MTWYRIQHSNSKCETEVFGLRVDTTQVIVGIMTMTSDERHIVSNHRLFDYLFNSLKRLQRTSNAEKYHKHKLCCVPFEKYCCCLPNRSSEAMTISQYHSIHITPFQSRYIHTSDWSLTCNITWTRNVTQKKVCSFHFKDNDASLLRKLSVHLFTQADNKDSFNVGGGSWLILMSTQLILRSYSYHNGARF